VDTSIISVDVDVDVNTPLAQIVQDCKRGVDVGKTSPRTFVLIISTYLGLLIECFRFLPFAG